MSNYKLLIGGKLVDGDATMDVINPATEEVLAVCPRGSERQLNEAVAAAKTAFKSWRKVPMEDRRALVNKLADAIDARTVEFARLLTQEQGKPLAESTAEITYTAAFLRYLASLNLENKLIEDNDNRRVEMRRKPLGVVGCINHQLEAFHYNFNFLLRHGIHWGIVALKTDGMSLIDTHSLIKECLLVQVDKACTTR